MGKIEKNFIYNTLYQLFIMIVPLITAPYLARVLGATNLGIYSFVSTSTNIIVTIGLLGIYNYGTRKVAYTRDNSMELSRNFLEIMVIRLVLCIFVSLAYLFISNQTDYTLYFYLYLPWVLATCLDCTWIFVGIENMAPAVLKNFFAKLSSVILIFIFVKNESDLWIYILIISLTTLIANLTVYIQLKGIIIKAKLKLRNFKTHLNGSLNLFLPQVAALFYLQIGKVMIQLITGDSKQVAYYDQAEKIVQIPMSLITALSIVMMPRIANEFSKNNYDRVKEYLLKAGKFSLLCSIPMSFGIASIANNFVPWYLGESFYPVVFAIIILSPLILINSLAGISGNQYFTATNQTNILFKSYISAAIINITLNVILIPIWGYIGSGIAAIISGIVSVVIQFFYLHKQIKMNSLFKFGVRYFILGTVMLFIILYFGRLLPPSIITTFLQISIGVIVYFGLLFLFKDKLFMELINKLVLRFHK